MTFDDLRTALEAYQELRKKEQMRLNAQQVEEQVKKQIENYEGLNEKENKNVSTSDPLKAKELIKEYEAAALRQKYILMLYELQKAIIQGKRFSFEELEKYYDDFLQQTNF